MTTRVVDVTCPGCGSPWSTDQRSCEYCGREVVITSMSSLREITPQQLRKHLRTFQDAVAAGDDQPTTSAAMGVCFLRLGRHDDAADRFAEAMREDIDDPEIYFLAAVAALGGKKAFLNPLARIREAESLVRAAIALEDRGIFFYVLAYLAYDFYDRKSLNPPEHWSLLLERARHQGASHADIAMLFELLGVEDPFA